MKCRECSETYSDRRILAESRKNKGKRPFEVSTSSEIVRNTSEIDGALLRSDESGEERCEENEVMVRPGI